MTRSSEEYEFARKIMKREAKNPNIYSANRREAMLGRLAKDKDLGDPALREFTKEFKKEFEKDMRRR